MNYTYTLKYLIFFMIYFKYLKLAIANQSICLSDKQIRCSYQKIDN